MNYYKNIKMSYQINTIEDIYDIFFNSVFDGKSYFPSPKMHYMKRTVQAEGWKGDYNVFLKRSFYFDFYITNKNIIPNNEIKANEFIKLHLDTYIEKRNPQNVFTTKLMDKNTEDNISPRNNINSVKDIENNFDKYIKRKKLKENSNNQHILKLKDEPVEYVSNYFLLQKTRSIAHMIYLVRDYFQNIRINKNVAYYFREVYNNKIPEIFYTYYSQTVNQTIHIKEVYVNSLVLKSKKIITIGEINCINLFLYNSQINIFDSYDKYLNDIDIAAISGEYIYILIRNYNKNEEQIYMSIINLIAESWNSFSFQTSYQYLVCPSTVDFKDYLVNMIYDAHINNNFEKQFNPIMEKLLEIESLIK